MTVGEFRIDGVIESETPFIVPTFPRARHIFARAEYEFWQDRGLWFEPAPGHTAGNVVIRLEPAGTPGAAIGGRAGT